ncbi:MAG: araC [Bacteriovoracaceae bacterium]|nr:araC [Bacteriovoracaceae bacterium]
MNRSVKLGFLAGWLVSTALYAQESIENARALPSYVNAKKACAYLLRTIDNHENGTAGNEDLQAALTNATVETEKIGVFQNQPSTDKKLFFRRRDYESQRRVQKALTILKENLAEPPSLKELARRVGCSSFYLSRIFTQTTGKTISATLRDLRIERAANLLREGRMNVTEVATEVGYYSVSHFSSVFHETIGCCPRLYPVN